MNSYYLNKAKDSEQQAVNLMWLAIIALCVGSVYCTFKWVTHKCPETFTLRPQSIGESQQILKEAGYYNGKIDYKWGPLMEAAYCNYKADEAISLMEK